MRNKRTLWLAAFLAVMLSLVMASSAMAAPPVSKSGSPAVPVELNANINDQPAVFAVTDVATDPDGDSTLSLASAGYPCGYQDETHFNYYPWDLGGQETCNLIVTDGTSYANVLVNITTTSGGPPPDTENPVVAISSPVNGSTVSTSSVTLNYTATDNSGVAPTCNKVNGSTVSLVEGSNTITVTCTDGAGNVGSATVNVTYTPPPPPPTNHAPHAEFLATGSNNLVATVDGSASSDPDAGDSIVTYVWDFGDGTVIGAAAVTSHTYIYPGTYTVKLTVTDTGGLSDTETGSVKVTAPPLKLTVSSGIGYEGDPGDPTTYIVFQVSLNRPTTQNVDIGYWAEPDSAKCSDFDCNILLPKVKTIPAGQTTTQIKIAIKNDYKVEGSEKMILLYLSCDVPTAGYVYGTIVDDANG